MTGRGNVGPPRPPMSFPTFTVIAVPVLALFAAAGKSQDKPGKSTQVIMRLTTVRPDLAYWVVDNLPIAVDSEIPEIDADEQLTVVLTADRALKMRAEKAGTLVLDLHLRPRPFKSVVKDKAGIVGGLIRGLAFTLLVKKLRGEPRYVARAMKGVTGFPEQLDVLDLKVRRRGPARKGGEKNDGLQIDLELTPVQGSWLHRVVTGIRPNKRGAHLMRTPHAALSLAAAVEGAALGDMIAPFAENLASLRGRSKKERAEFRSLVVERTKQFDGSFSLLIDGPGRYVRLVGLSEPRGFVKLAAQDAGVRFDTRRLGRLGIQIDDKMPTPLEKSSMKILRKESDFLEVVTDEADDPEKLLTFSGVARDFSIKVRWPKDGTEVARLLDRIEKRRLRRLPLIGGALLVAELNFGGGRLRKMPRIKELTEEFGALLGPRGFEDVLAAIPEHIEITVYKLGGEKLHLRVVTR